MTQPTRIYKHSSAGTDWAALALGAGLGLTLALQLTTVRLSDFNTFYSLVVSVSRLTALVGTYFAVVGMFLIARIPWVERGVGHDRLVTWHRKLGPWSLYLIGAHVFLIIVGFAGQDSIPLYKELWQFLTLYEWMWFALAGFVLMVLAGVTSYKKARAKMSYETWWMVHVLTYSAVAASFMHQIVNGSMFVGHPLNKAYWISLYAAMGSVITFCENIDRDFSTYKEGSWISRLRRGEVAIEDCPDDVIEVWDLCAQAKWLSDGAFDPWAVAGGFDPSGLVKGWAADKCADMLVAAGAEHVQVNAAGDLSLRGGFVDSDGVVKPWPIGVINPNNKLEVVKIYEITDGAIATSGTYERGAHIHDPQTGMIAIGAASATVVGPLGWLCDAMATAVMVGGADSAKWFGQPELQGYQVFGVNRHEESAWEI